jgi:hypothetical protein
MGVSGQRHAPAARYPRGKDPRYPLYRRLGGPQSRSGKILCLCRGSNLNCPVVQPVARHYTDRATRLTVQRVSLHKFLMTRAGSHTKCKHDQEIRCRLTDGRPDTLTLSQLVQNLGCLRHLTMLVQTGVIPGLQQSSYTSISHGRAPLCEIRSVCTTGSWQGCPKLHWVVAGGERKGEKRRSLYVVFVHNHFGQQTVSLKDNV